MGVYFFCEVTTAISIFFLRKIRKKRMLKSAAVCKEEGKIQVWKDGLPVSVLFRDTENQIFFMKFIGEI